MRSKYSLFFIVIALINVITVKKMGCMDSQPEITPHRPQNRHRTPKQMGSRKTLRLMTKYKSDQIRQITDQQRRAGFKPVYSCPICFLRFNKILACQTCTNCICHNCFQTYDRKTKRNFLCPFCKSDVSLFKDYEEQAHSYFDTTGNGFISPEQRKKLDAQMADQKGQNSKLQPIQEVEAA